MKFTNSLLKRATSVVVAMATALLLVPSAAIGASPISSKQEDKIYDLTDNLSERFAEDGSNSVLTTDLYYAALGMEAYDCDDDIDAEALLEQLWAESSLDVATLAKYIVMLDCAGEDVEDLEIPESGISVADDEDADDEDDDDEDDEDDDDDEDWDDEDDEDDEEGDGRNLIKELDAAIEAAGTLDIQTLAYVLPVFSIDNLSAITASGALTQVLNAQSSAGLFGGNLQTTAEVLIGLMALYDWDFDMADYAGRKAVSKAVTALLDAQNSDGGFYYSKGSSDLKTTALVAAALTTYYDEDLGIKPRRIASALLYILGQANSSLNGFKVSSSEAPVAAACFYALALIVDADIDYEEADQTIKVSPTSKSLTKTAVKKKATKVAVKVKNAETALTYKFVNKKAKKALTVKVNSKKKVTITVKKGAAKGKYQVKIWAQETSDWEQSNVKTITITVK